MYCAISGEVRLENRCVCLLHQTLSLYGGDSVLSVQELQLGVRLTGLLCFPRHGPAGAHRASGEH